MSIIFSIDVESRVQACELPISLFSVLSSLSLDFNQFLFIEHLFMICENKLQLHKLYSTVVNAPAHNAYGNSICLKENSLYAEKTHSYPSKLKHVGESIIIEYAWLESSH